MNGTVIPNFFIIGAPKCGTTALSQYLLTHPDIFFSTQKEPHYFSDDLQYKINNRYADFDSYMNLFADRKREKRVGEGSVLYLYSKCAIDNILNYNPEAKFIVLLRDPVEIAISLHQQFVWTGRENIHNFEKAWKLQDKRLAGVESVTDRMSDPKLAQYGQIAKVGTQLMRAKEKIKEDNLLILTLDEMQQDTRSVYRKVLHFLELEDDGRKDFPKVNQAKRPKSKLFHTMIHKIPAPVKKMAINIKRPLGIREWGFINKLKSFNQKKEKNLISSSMKNKLDDYFYEERRIVNEILVLRK